jgi:hypothetical protein
LRQRKPWEIGVKEWNLVEIWAICRVGRLVAGPVVTLAIPKQLLSDRREAVWGGDLEKGLAHVVRVVARPGL